MCIILYIFGRVFGGLYLLIEISKPTYKIVDLTRPGNKQHLYETICVSLEKQLKEIVSSLE